MTDLRFRQFTPADADQIACLFHDTIHAVNRQDYSPAQLAAWAPEDIYFQDWVAFCTNRITFVAEINGIIAGFANLESDGYVNCFYCHKDYQGQGIGKGLYQAIEAKALELGCDRLFADVSITAKPFFQRMGFEVVQEQTVERRGEHFINFRMQKNLLISSFQS